MPLGDGSKYLRVTLLNIYGLIRTDKLRAILLFEADFNIANKFYFGSRLMKRAKRLVALTQEQHSGRSVHTSI